MNGTLNGNDIITKDNLELVKDYLNSNFPSIDVNCELKDDQMFLEFSGQKFLLDPNTKVNDLIYSFNQYVGNDTSSAPVIQDSTVDNRTYDSRTRRNRVAVKQYRIDIDEDLYNGVCSSLSSLSSSIATAGASYDASMLTGKLAKFYNGLGVTNENITSAKTMVEDIGLKVKYCLELYKSTDQELQYFFNQMVNQVFAYDDFKNGGSVEYLTIEEKETNIRNYINYLSETYDAVYQEYLKLYCNGESGEGVLLTADAAQLLAGLAKSFNLDNYMGYFGLTDDGNGYMDINPLAEVVSFLKDNNVIDKLKKYTGGASWEESGMAELNEYILGWKLQDFDNDDNEKEFLCQYFNGQDNNYIDSFQNQYGQTINSLIFDSNDAEVMKSLKDRLKNQTDSFSLEDTQQRIDDKEAYKKTVASLSSQVYNLKQYEKLMPYDEIRKDPDYLKYLGTQYDASGEFQWYDQSELAIYHYVYDKEGFDAANKYLQAMDDTVNQRKGFVAAAKYVELLNSGHETADIISELSPILGAATDGFVTLLNTGISGTDGFVSGLFTFGKGFYNLVHADGVRDVSDYAMMFKAQLMSEENEYNENMSDWQRQLYYHNNQIMSSVGNMAIPCLLSSLGVPALGKAALFLSAMGNSTENTMQEGYSTGQAYLFGALSATLELATESILGSLPGLGGNAPDNIASLKGVEFLKALGMSMFDEGKEEFIQSYAEAGLRYLVLGEPIDLSQTTSEAIQSFIYGAISSGIMNAGSIIPVRLANGKVVNLNVNDVDKINDLSFDGNIRDSAVLSTQHTNASYQSIVDVENVIDILMNKYNISRSEALSIMQQSIDEQRFNNITRDGDARNTIMQLGFNGLSDALEIIRGMDRVTDSGIRDVEYGIDQLMQRFNINREEAIDQLELLIKDGDFTKMTRQGNARAIIQQYSLEELDSILTKIKVDAYNSMNTNSSNGKVLDPNGLLAELRSKYGITYGVDQGAIYDLFTFYGEDGKVYSYREASMLKNEAMEQGKPLPRFKKVGSSEYFKIKEFMYDRYGLTSNAASILLSTIDDVGACSYASVANEIFTSFEGDESKFEQNFGFPMYDKDTGKPNYSLLLADLYLNVNQQSNGGSLVKVDPNTGQITLNQEAFNTKIDPLGRRLLNAENQAYLSNSGGKNVIAINNYLKTRGANFTTQVVSGVDNHSQVSFRSLEPVINGGLDRGYNYSLGIYSRGDEIRLISVDGRGTVSTKTWGEGGGHSVYVTGISEQGIVVSSWGGKYVIPFEDLSQSNARWILTKDKVNVQ